MSKIYEGIEGDDNRADEDPETPVDEGLAYLRELGMEHYWEATVQYGDKRMPVKEFWGKCGTYAKPLIERVLAIADPQAQAEAIGLFKEVWFVEPQALDGTEITE